MDVRIAQDWKEILQEEFEKPYFEKLVSFIKQEKKQYTVFPTGKDIFSAFDRCSFDKVKVVILGQDPYHGEGQAHGLCFSVNDGVQFPPSLRNIFKELNDDVGKEIPTTGDLRAWANQGILLLNATLTVRAHQAGSHQKKGWEEFTDAVIQKISDKKEGIVFLLWGAYAQRKGQIIDAQKHHVLKAVHPSPLSAHRGFFGCKHFSETNRILKKRGENPIVW